MTTANLFGVEGLTIGGLGIWGILFMLLGSLAVWWIRGIPDRTRADNEAIPAKAAASDALFKNMQAEIRRMGQKIDRLEKRVDDLEREKSKVIGERDAALAETARLRAVNDGQGQMRQDAATLVAAERLRAAQAGRAT